MRSVGKVFRGDLKGLKTGENWGRITVRHGVRLSTKNRKKSLLTLEPVAIMRVATRSSGFKLYKLERETRSMWNVKQGSEHEKTDCGQQSALS